MAAGAYQSFPGSSGASQSDKKLERLSLPRDLSGMSVLDIGCNEGFFCIEAARRGAARVVGIDQNARFIDAAIKRSRAFPQIRYINGDAMHLPGEKFDFVFVLSVLHYFKEPYNLLNKISSMLNNNGTLVLECGVAPGTGKAVRRVLRSIDEQIFPTSDMLRAEWLKDYSVRYIAPSVPQAGDPVPRSVFHCTRKKPSVMLVPGEGGIGKTTLSLELEQSATVISTDSLIQVIGDSSDRTHPAQKAFDEARHRLKGSIRLAWNEIRKNPSHLAYFVDAFTRSIRMCQPASLIVVEGYCLQDIADGVVKALGDDFRCWIVSRASAGAS